MKLLCSNLFKHRLSLFKRKLIVQHFDRVLVAVCAVNSEH